METSLKDLRLSPLPFSAQKDLEQQQSSDDSEPQDSVKICSSLARNQEISEKYWAGHARNLKELLTRIDSKKPHQVACVVHPTGSGATTVL